MNLQVIPVPLEKINDSKSEDDVSVYFPEEEHYNGEYSYEDKTIDNFINTKILNRGNFPQQQGYSSEYCNGKNVSHPELPGSGKYFLKLIHIPPGQTLQR